MINWEKLSRITLIDATPGDGGIIFERYDIKADYMLQDDERTLKIFFSDLDVPKATPPYRDAKPKDIPGDAKDWDVCTMCKRNIFLAPNSVWYHAHNKHLRCYSYPPIAVRG